MFHVNKDHFSFRTFAFLLPLLLSGAPLSSRPLLGTLLLCASIFAAAALVPAFRHRENLAVFLMVFFCGIPANIHMAAAVIRFLEFEQSFFFAAVYGSLIALLLFSTEEIVFGVLTRLLWKRQYKIVFE